MMEPEITYWDNGQKYREVWYKNGIYHRVDGPTYSEWYENGQILVEEWIVNGDYHRVDGPAYSEWHHNGQKFSEEWHIDGKRYPSQEYATALVKNHYKTKAEALFLLLKWR